MVWPTLGSRTAKEQEQEQELVILAKTFVSSLTILNLVNYGFNRTILIWSDLWSN